jgi:hypothetical protein
VLVELLFGAWVFAVLEQGFGVVGGRVAGPALVRRDEEIEAAAGYVGNLDGAPRAIVESRLGGAAVDVGSDLLGVGARPPFLRAICSIPSFGMAKVAVNVCSPDTSTIPTKIPTYRLAGIG